MKSFAKDWQHVVTSLKKQEVTASMRARIIDVSTITGLAIFHRQKQTSR